MIVLFDIDGTLTTGSRWGREALEAAVDERLGTRGALEGVVLHGNLDALIVREAAERAGRWPASPSARRALVADVLARYVELFHGGVDARPYRALQGADEAVRLAQGACEVVGLATGNVEACARAKLRSAGLWGLFDGCCGGYGDEGETRAEVVALAVRRARERGARARDVLVIGDTPQDVAAAHGAGARVAAVATGRYEAAALRAVGADAVFDDLVALAAAPPWR